MVRQSLTQKTLTSFGQNVLGVCYKVAAWSRPPAGQGRGRGGERLPQVRLWTVLAIFLINCCLQWPPTTRHCPDSASNWKSFYLTVYNTDLVVRHQLNVPRGFISVVNQNDQSSVTPTRLCDWCQVNTIHCSPKLVHFNIRIKLWVAGQRVCCRSQEAVMNFDDPSIINLVKHKMTLIVAFIKIRNCLNNSCITIFHFKEDHAKIFQFWNIIE